MKILWICNIMLPDIAEKLHKEYSNKEGWLTGILSRLKAADRAEDITLGICFPVEKKDTGFCRTLDLSADETKPFLVECFGIAEDLTRPEIYDDRLETEFSCIFDTFKPELVHIFGTEFPHTLAAARTFKNPGHLLIGLQGIISECADCYTAGLSKETVRHNTFRDIIKRDGILKQQEKFYRRGIHEKEALQLTGNVTGRTLFDKDMTVRMNPMAVYYAMNETMRQPFYQDKWELPYCRKHRIFFSQADYPLKGFHILLEALPSILLHYPDTEIVVAGNSVVKYRTWKDKIKIGGYGQYLRKYMNDWELTSRVEFLGKLTAEEMKEQYLLCHTFVCASALENSPNSVAEAMLLGTPVVASKTGGIPSMITDGKEGLLFEKENPQELAKSILKLWESEELCLQLSQAGSDRARITHNPQRNYERLLEIYHQILD